MSYLLDTTHVVDHLRGDPDLVQLLAALAPVGIAVNIVTYLEAFQGTLRLQQPVPVASFDAFFDAVPVLPLTPAIALRPAARAAQAPGQTAEPARFRPHHCRDCAGARLHARYR